MGMFTPHEIKELRESMGLSITEFAVRIGVSAATVSSWEAGRRHPAYDRLVKLNELQERNGHKRKAVAK